MLQLAVLHSLRYGKQDVYINGFLALNILNYREKDFRGDVKAPGLKAVSTGWHSLSTPGKWLFSLLCGVLLAACIFSQWPERQPVTTGLYLLAILIAAANYLRARVLPQLMARSLLNDLTLQQNRICIAGFILPDTVRKLVLGQQGKQGPAYLQLAWNGGQLWRFPLAELPQVEQFIRQHAAQIEIIRE